MNTKQWYMSKTIWVAVLTALIGLWNTIYPMIPKDFYPQIIAVLGILFTILRKFTDKPLGN